MKITFKTTVGRTIDADFPPTATIKELRESLTEYDFKSLKLCYKGAILADDKTLVECNIDEGQTIFITGKKAGLAKASTTTSTTAPSTSATSAQPASSEAPTPPTTTVPTPAPATTTPTPTTTTTSPPVSAAPPSQTTPTPASAPAESTTAQLASTPASLTAGVNEEQIAELVAMGFDRTMAALALRAAYNDANRAVDYLITGVSEERLRIMAEDAMPSRAVPATRPSASPAPPRPSAPSSGLRAALTALPNFDEIRATVQRNPETLQTVIQEIQARHPEILELIQGNEPEFLQIMQETSRGGATGATARRRGPPQVGSVLALALPGGGYSQTTVTQEDMNAAQNLVEVGAGTWDLQAALLSYLMAGRQQEMAAAILFEHGGFPGQVDDGEGEGGEEDGEGNEDNAS